MKSHPQLASVLAALYVSVVPFAAHAQPTKDCASLVPERAIRSCTALLDAEPGDARKKAFYLTQRARAYIDARQFSAAEKDIAAAFAAYPDYPPAYGMRGRFFSAQEQHEKALEDYNTYLRLSDSKFSPLISRGTYFLRMAKLPEAAADFEAAKALRATAGAPYLGLARVRRLENNAEAAFSTLEAGLNVDPTNVTLLVERGEMRLDRKDMAGARADFEKALEFEPGLQRALKGRERAALAGPAETPREAATPGPQGKPAQTTEARLDQAAGLRREAKWAEALALYDDILKVEPKSTTALSWRGVCLEQLGEHDAAFKAYSAVLSVERLPQEDLARATVGIARFAVNREYDYRTAVKLTSMLLERNPNHDEALRIRIVANFKRTQFETAAADASRLASLPEHAVEGRGWQALSLAGAGKLEQAQKLGEELMKVNADHALAHAALAWTALQREQLQTAETESKKAIASDPSSAEVAFVHQLVLLHKAIKAADEQSKTKNRG